MPLPFNNIGYPEGVGIDGPGIRHAATGGHEAAIGHKEILNVMGAAVAIQHRCFRVFTEAAATGNQVLGG